MLRISSSKVAQIILLAHELRMNSGEMEILTEDLSEDEVQTMGRMDDDAIRSFIGDLNEEEQTDLIALAWIGRDTFTVDELDEARATVVSEATSETADYLLGMPELAEYLESGLDAFGISAEDEEDDIM
ncbi:MULTISPECIES: DUF3775 domain-containing protein [Donghicola]|uniref:DUF3775 domain-containing protein n=1 Tax=Donghicola eburneus TaxID=393278 RepID=A0A1M4N409_9RHOB|nr:DUF3775 domain-containing protein [Donghicola eburneus]SCM69620.1 hypothetical protein KARMA_3859 [Donghicola eburneus]SFQ49249.1 Protein of unknown function [Donghicola eburneus]